MASLRAAARPVFTNGGSATLVPKDSSHNLIRRIPQLHGGERRVVGLDIGRGKARLRAHFEFAERQVPLERK